MFIRVREFHSKFNVLISDVPQFPDQKTRMLRRDLLREELQEFCEAYAVNDLVEMADAIVDMAVIACGTCVSYGIALTVPFESPHKDGTKQDIFLTTKIDTILTKMVEAYEAAEDASDLGAVLNRLMELIQHLFGVALHYGFPFNEIFAEVHRSNMSKLGEDGLPVYRADGKVLKGPNFTKPDIRSILINSGIIKLPPEHGGDPRFTDIPTDEPVIISDKLILNR